MKNRLILSIFLPAVYVVLTSSGGNTTPPWQKENVSFPMMNQEIRHTMEENDRQKTMKNRQDINLAAEVVNKKEWEKFKETTTKIQERLRLVDFAMQAIPTGYAIFLESQKIQDIQEKIITEIQTAPYSLVVVLPAEIRFIDDMQMVVRLLSGIVISYGAINQMEKAERKILLEYALAEVTNLRRDALFMLMKVRDIKRKVEWTRFVILNYINKDKQIVEQIISHF
ncbi:MULTISPECIES: hypothetical protein [unclassified Kaistella]|uniref:hypothetical protein n=1 Tax=unclassified Kaistella TaxID=2762626 RepID=UPI002732C4ED|nr:MULTISPECIES: hypothetical protein [unclassified Kaistella]MDP2455229.1 hypothetical protein [Kaistella sp. SH11-4b]MDP2458076.1 hypothetical protein [Kaistella sp. SH40-3]MDP2461043.1 hypothetical protein [Kaistella sp. SH19-2b]